MPIIYSAIIDVRLQFYEDCAKVYHSYNAVCYTPLALQKKV